MNPTASEIPNSADRLWQGRSSGKVAPELDRINASLAFDQRLAAADIAGSLAHVKMLGRQGILSAEETEAIAGGLQSIETDLAGGALDLLASDAEDIHTFIELELTRRIGTAGKKLHTGRSRNDQVALDLRLYLRSAIDDLDAQMEALQSALARQADQHKNTMMPGFTHLQPAQPVTFAYHLQAYAAMLGRDRNRLADCRKRVNVSPLGAGALAGSTLPLDRAMTAELLGMSGYLANTLDAVSARDFVIETLGVLSILMTHLSRLAEELVLWSSQAFGFITLDTAYTTGSSLMPQKKNPDAAELVRGKTGRVFGDLMTMLTVIKALPLAYNKDMQEDKEALFDALDTVALCLPVITGMIASMAVHPDAMRQAARHGFLNATDLADYLVRKGMPFREAYALTGQIVAHCLENDMALETLPLAAYQTFSALFGPDVFAAIDLQTCVARRNLHP